MELRPWQEEAFAELQKHDFNGVVKVPSGKGKTVLGIALINHALKEHKEKALVVVPTIQLAHQWQNELKKFLPERTSSLYYGAKKDLSGEIIISVINTAAKNPFAHNFCIKVLDEIHHYGAELFQDIFAVSTPHTIGLSATPEREDEGDLAIRYGAGSIVYSLHNLEELRERFSLCTIFIPFIPPELHAYQEARQEYQRMLIIGNLKTSQVTYKARRGNKFALRVLKLWSEMTKLRHFASNKLPVIKRIVKAESDKKIIIFSESIPYSEALGESLPNSIVVHSTLTKKEILSRLEEFRSLDKGILIAPRMIDEGYDVPDATISIVASFTRKSRQMIQRDGRLLRQSEAVRRYTLVIEDVEEEKFARILRETETESIALDGEWLVWRNGFVSDVQGKAKIQEEIAHPERKDEWLMQKLDFFTRTEQVDSEFYIRHEAKIQKLLMEHPQRWPLLEKKQTPPPQTLFTLEHTHSEAYCRDIKNQLRKLNARLFLPQGVFQAIFRYLDRELIELEVEDKEVLERIVDDPNMQVWTEELITIIKEMLRKMHST
jgi:superfamily II DNA or RNA helicase